MRRQPMQKQHLLGAGLIATLVAIYPFAANLGVVPQDATQLLKIPAGMGPITLPNGTQISLQDLQHQVQQNPALASFVNNLLHQNQLGQTGYGTGYGNSWNASLPNNGFNTASYGGSPYPATGYGQSGYPTQNLGYPSQAQGNFANQGFGQSPYAGQTPYQGANYGQAGYASNNGYAPQGNGLPSTYAPRGNYQAGGYSTGAGGATHLTSFGSNGYGQSQANDVTVKSFANGNCTQFIQEEIQRAQRKIFIQASSFTSKPVADALIQAHNRHIEVFVILDRTAQSESYSQAPYLTQYGVPVLFGDQSSTSRYMLIDGTTVLSSPFNFTNQVETANAENMMVVRNRPDVYQSFEATFQQAYQRIAALAGNRVGATQGAYGQGAYGQRTAAAPWSTNQATTYQNQFGSAGNSSASGSYGWNSNSYVPTQAGGAGQPPLPSTAPAPYRTGIAR